MSETYPGFQPGGFQAALEGDGGFQVALLVPAVPAAHWVPRAFHGAHWRVGHWIGEPVFVPPVVHRRHWVTRAFHATHWGQTHWTEGEAAPPLSVTVEGDLRLVIGLDAVTTGPRRVETGGGVFTLPLKRRVPGELGLVIALDARTAMRRRRAVAGALPIHIGLDARTQFRDRIAIEDDELLSLGLV